MQNWEQIVKIARKFYWNENKAKTGFVNNFCEISFLNKKEQAEKGYAEIEFLRVVLSENGIPKDGFSCYGDNKIDGFFLKYFIKLLESETFPEELSREFLPDKQIKKDVFGYLNNNDGFFAIEICENIGVSEKRVEKILREFVKKGKVEYSNCCGFMKKK